MNTVKFNANGGIAMARLPAHPATRRLANGDHVRGVGTALAIVPCQKARLMVTGMSALMERSHFNAGCVPIRRVIVEFFVMFGRRK
jgi:hypothetical protein